MKKGYTMYCGPSDDVFGLSGMIGRAIQVRADDSGYYRRERENQYEGFIARVAHNLYLQDTNIF